MNTTATDVRLWQRFMCVEPAMGRLIFAHIPLLSEPHFQTFGGSYVVESVIDFPHKASAV